MFRRTVGCRCHRQPRRELLLRLTIDRTKQRGCTYFTVAGTLLFAWQAWAAPSLTPFLSVDFNGYNADGGQVKGPTEAGFQDFEAGQGLFVPAAVRWDNSGAAGLTKVFPTTDGNITVNLRGIAPNSTLFARNRGANSGGLPGMQQDFAAAQRGLNGFGQNYLRLQLSGLIPGQTYEFTGFSREPSFNSAVDHVGSAPLASYASWTDIATLGGIDGPGPWMNANVGPLAVYQPIYTDDDLNPATPDVDTGYKNPIPNKGRSPVSGPDSLSASDPYHHSLSFQTTADAGGNITVYNWSDPNGYGSTSQGASLISGFQLGRAPGHPVVFDPFDYSPGANLLGAAGGYGFAGPWGPSSAIADFSIADSSLSYPGLVTSGNRVTSPVYSTAIGSIGRRLTNPLGQPGTTQYLSFVVRPEGTLHEGQSNGFFGLRLETASSGDLFVGKPGGGATDRFVMENAGGTLQHATDTTIEAGRSYLLVLRAEFATVGNDMLTLYVNPMPGAPEPTGGTLKSDFNFGMINDIFLYSTGAFSIDELRIGPSYADVVPSLPGDYNADGIVNSADYTVWRDHLGQDFTLVNQELSAATPGFVDNEDFNFWKLRFGNSLGSDTGQFAAVPEPGSIMLVGFVAAMLLSQRKKSTRMAPVVGRWSCGVNHASHF